MLGTFQKVQHSYAVYRHREPSMQHNLTETLDQSIMQRWGSFIRFQIENQANSTPRKKRVSFKNGMADNRITTLAAFLPLYFVRQ